MVANEPKEGIISGGNNGHAKYKNQEEVPWGRAPQTRGEFGFSEETRWVRNYRRGQHSGKGTVKAMARDRGGFFEDIKEAGVAEAW